jgi:hypothetical protein
VTHACSPEWGWVQPGFPKWSEELNELGEELGTIESPEYVIQNLNPGPQSSLLVMTELQFYFS